MEDLIAEAQHTIAQAIRFSRNPVIAFSGGKDSMVLLHLTVNIMGHKLPVLFHREPFQHHKYIFGMRTLAGLHLTAYDYPPAGRSMWLGKGILAFTNRYQVGRTADGKIATLDLPKNIVRDDSASALCGKEHFINGPTGLFNYPWDMVLHGQKNSDEDQIAGKTPLTCDIKQNVGAPSAAFPLRRWTDKEVWIYTKANKLPVDRDRYDLEGEKELPDKSWNSDYFAACVRCIDKRDESVVICPKTGLQISNISSQVPYASPMHEHQMEPSA